MQDGKQTSNPDATRAVGAFLPAWLLAWLEKFMPTQPRVVAFLLTLVGVSRKNFDVAPRHEQVAYLSLALLMIVAASVTGIGLSRKLGVAFDLGIAGVFGILMIASVFALLLEIVVIGTVRNKSRSVWSIALRVALGGCLTATQVITLLVMMWQPLIDQYQHDKVQDTVMRARDKAMQIENVADVQKHTRELQQVEADAKRNVSSPPAHPKVTAASEKLDTAEKNLRAAVKAVDDARRRLAEAQARLSLEPPLSRRREAIEKAISFWSGQLAQRRAAINTAEADKSNAEADKALAIKTRDDELQAALADATKARSHQEEVQRDTERNVERAKNTADELGQKAAKSRFVNDAAALLALMPQNPSVLFVSLFVLMLAMVIDLLPLVVKLQLSKGVIAGLEEDEMELARARSGSASALELRQIERLQLQSTNDLAAFRLFTQTDQGATEASMLARRAQLERDSLTAQHEARVLVQGLGAIREALEDARELHSMAQESPALGELYRTQLQALIARLEAASATLASGMRPSAATR